MVVGLVMNEKAPRASPCWRSSSIVTICTGMCRVFGFCFSWLSTVQPSMSGRNTSSDTADRLIFLRQRQRVGAAHRHQHLEALVVRKIGDDAGIVRIVLDDEQDRVARFEPVAVVRDVFDRRLRQAERRLHDECGGLRHGAGDFLRPRRPRVFRRQIEREGPADARRRCGAGSRRPSSVDSSRLMARPKPVPPYLRLVRRRPAGTPRR